MKLWTFFVAFSNLTKNNVFPLDPKSVILGNYHLYEYPKR